MSNTSQVGSSSVGDLWVGAGPDIDPILVCLATYQILCEPAGPPPPIDADDWNAPVNITIACDILSDLDVLSAFENSTVSWTSTSVFGGEWDIVDQYTISIQPSLSTIIESMTITTKVTITLASRLGAVLGCSGADGTTPATTGSKHRNYVF